MILRYDYRIQVQHNWNKPPYTIQKKTVVMRDQRA